MTESSVLTSVTIASKVSSDGSGVIVVEEAAEEGVGEDPGPFPLLSSEVSTLTIENIMISSTTPIPANMGSL